MITVTSERRTGLAEEDQERQAGDDRRHQEGQEDDELQELAERERLPL